ncbi:MAG: glycoside hydrolase family 3 C-terminal domain-containing protein [Candidatus Lokiarchaeota archaeon]|nr:glycoside hydrolase family 3 C-terminal domain-containing protein [Candidatus Lokiarchaeota archaeon]
MDNKKKKQISSYLNTDIDIEFRINDLIEKFTLEEKFKMCSGFKTWYTAPIDRLNIPSFKMTDGPHGVRSLSSRGFRGTYFPVAICRTATWNEKLSLKFGKAIAKEVKSIGYHMILAPGINIHRTPLGGRTFEYQTEDPYLNKKIALAVVKGVQSKDIAACIKHFICNNQEKNRFTYDAIVSRRALEEIYFPAFKTCVEEGNAWSVMGSYNKINGTYGCENKFLIKNILMNKWGFNGFVISDWDATQYINNSEDCINAGLSLEMPIEVKFTIQSLKKAYQEGKFTIETLNENLRRLLRVMFLVGIFDNRKGKLENKLNISEHQNLSRKIAEEGIVLLKNEDNFLPLDIKKIKKLAILGPNADKELALGGGSSEVHPPYEITPLQGFKEKCKGKIEITNSPIEADVSILIMGLNHNKGMDSEDMDRISFELPPKQIKLINETKKENPNIIVILINGSPISFQKWIDDIPAVIEAWYPGLEGGRAIADIIFGDINPSGKLPITFPKKLTDSPAHKSIETYPGKDKVEYREGIYIGYRYFDTENIDPLFPFGFGLSYTDFKYNNLKIDKEVMKNDEKIKITVDILNSGNRYGAEIVQLYIQDIESSIDRPLKELKGFKKVYLQPKQKERVEFTIKKEDLSYYDENINSWITEKGEFIILIGSSSKDIRLSTFFKYIG